MKFFYSLIDDKLGLRCVSSCEAESAEELFKICNDNLNFLYLGRYFWKIRFADSDKEFDCVTLSDFEKVFEYISTLDVKLNFAVSVLNKDSEYSSCTFSVRCFEHELFEACCSEYVLKPGQQFYCFDFSRSKSYYFPEYF